ncbi:MAG: hypothetical protein ACOC9A_02520 [Candidatus Bipolaricaulota bacterium]
MSDIPAPGFIEQLPEDGRVVDALNIKVTASRYSGGERVEFKLKGAVL